MTPLQQALAENRLVAFIGAGYSMAPPSWIPWDVNRATIDAMVGAAVHLLPEARQLGDVVNAHQQAFS